ncbi:N-succinyl-L,L-diaminopimelate desuccinylase [hydrothermal vent metagenome]|uniref:Succinyl-diaminopimelate desuccinylase n=1 Tax=hydrothermal vent metagenome TaxID=652676 RepID=A0A1W1BIV7_9ZZZZ
MTIELAKQLINQPSITPDDKDCQKIIAERLEKLGFTIKNLHFDGVDNLWAKKGNKAPLIVFAGHTDVVPVGDEDKWLSPPFEATIKNNKLYGRGSADMKGSIAAFITALETFINVNPDFQGSIGLLITSDEEGPAINGTIKVLDYLKQQNEQIDYCIVGEPTATKQVGDVIKNGRRGSLNGFLTVVGKQGHIAYPQLAQNPIHLIAPVLDDLCNEVWDEGNEYFEKTQFQISNINAGTGATNVTPNNIEVIFNFRYNTNNNFETLTKRVENKLKNFNLNYKIDWQHSGEPFITPKGILVNTCIEAIKSITNLDAQLSTTGGTSDGRFIAKTGCEIIELGPCNATIHQINECVGVDELKQLSQIYNRILCNLMS